MSNGQKLFKPSDKQIRIIEEARKAFQMAKVTAFHANDAWIERCSSEIGNLGDGSASKNPKR